MLAIRSVSNGAAARRIASLGCLAALAAATCGLVACGSEKSGSAAGSVLDEVKSRGTLRAGVRTDFPPHSYYNKDQRLVGFDMDVAAGVARELGTKLKVVKVDELTRISFLNARKIDLAAASMNHTIERDGEIDFSQTYFFSYQTFLVKENGKIKTLEDLVNKTVGFSRGGSPIGNWRDWLAERGHPPAKYVEFSDKQAAIQAVKQGAIAGFAEDYEAVKSFANANRGLTVLTGQSMGVKQDGLGVISNDSEWRDAVNYALQRMWSSGDYERIYRRWFGPKSDTPIWPMRGGMEVWPRG